MRFGKLLIVVALIATFVAPAAFAQRAPGSISLGGFGGVGMPQGPKEFKDYFKTSIGFGGELKYNMNETTSLGLSFTYMPFKINEDKMKEDFTAEMGDVPGLTLSGGESKINIISANVIKYFTQPDASTGFYLTLGGGYYMHSMGDLKVSAQGESETIKGDDLAKAENKFGVNGGLGLEFNAGEKLAVFVEGKYHYIFTKEEKDAETGETSGGKTTFITAMAGLRLSL